MVDPKQAKSNLYVAGFMSIVLILGALYAVFVTASEYDPETLIWMYLLIDAAMTGLLVILLVRVMRAEFGGGLKALVLILGPLGVIGGLIKLGARFSSDHGWWTGHYSYAF